jgi:CheY-like chemotaxis protein
MTSDLFDIFILTRSHRHLKSSLEIIVSPFPATMCLNIITDKHWFAENILCLLSNAVKYSNGGTVTVTIKHQLSVSPSESQSVSDSRDDCDPASSIGITDTDTDSLHVRSSDDIDGLGLIDHSTIRISIEDSGIGISEEACKDLFQPFKQVQRLAGGTGLGLYSLSNRIRALNGSRGVTSRMDGKQGSVFWFAIPYRPDPHFMMEPREDAMRSPDPVRSPLATDGPSTPEHVGTPADVGSLQSSSASSIGQKRRLHVLLVDDSPSIVKVLGRALRNKSYDVVTAENGSAGLDLLISGYAKREFNVVLMDLQMPIMDGIEAVKRYREFESNQRDKADSPCFTGTAVTRLPSRLLIIGMSANSDAATKQCASDVGMDEFLAKPFTIAELQPLIERNTSLRIVQSASKSVTTQSISA